MLVARYLAHYAFGSPRVLPESRLGCLLFQFGYLFFFTRYVKDAPLWMISWL
jgi:hypothetical protein